LTEDDLVALGPLLCGASEDDMMALPVETVR